MNESYILLFNLFLYTRDEDEMNDDIHFMLYNSTRQDFPLERAILRAYA